MGDPVKDLEGELRKDPRSKRFYDLAKEYQKHGRLDEAKTLCEQGLAIHPTMTPARILLSQLYLASGNMASARVLVERVLNVVPDNIPANHLAADIYFSMGEEEKSLKHYKIVQLFDPARTGVAEKIAKLSEAMNASAKAEDEALDAAEASPPLPPSAEDISPPETEEAQSAESPAPELRPPPAVQVPTEAAAEVYPQAPVPAEPELESLLEPPEVEPEIEQELEPGPIVSFDNTPSELEEVPLEMPEAQDTEQAKDFAIPPEDQFSEPQVPGRDFSSLEREPIQSADVLEKPLASLDSLPSQPSEPEFSFGDIFGQGDAGLEEVIPSGEVAFEIPKLKPKVAGASAPIAAPAEAESERALPPPDSSSISTITLAKLYEQQGYPEKAVEVYQRLLVHRPDDQEVLDRIGDLMEIISGTPSQKPQEDQEERENVVRQKRISALQDWLRLIREDRHVS